MVKEFTAIKPEGVKGTVDNRTVILTRQDFLPDHTADRDLLFIFSSNILDFGSRFEDSSRFYR